MTGTVKLSDIINDVSKSVSFDKPIINEVVREFLISLKHNVAEGKSVHLQGFGRFSASPDHVKVIQGKEVPTTGRVKFVPADPFKSLIRASR